MCHVSKCYLPYIAEKKHGIRLNDSKEKAKME